MKDSKENRKELLVNFLVDYSVNPKNNVEEIVLPENYGDDDFIDSLGEIISKKIDEKEEIAESISMKALLFIMFQLNKVSVNDEGKVFVKSENMPRNYSSQEREFQKWALDELLKFIQYCVSNSDLSEQEQDDFDLDIINFYNRLSSAEALNFDDSINPEDYKSYYF